MGLAQSAWRQQLRQAAVVFCGGTVGTLIRAVLSQVWTTDGWPWATFTINVTGSFALGFIQTGLQALGPDTGWRHMARLGLGTGLLGGFTTYSTFIVETDSLASGGHLALAVMYCAASVVVGVSSAFLGIGTAYWLRSRYYPASVGDSAGGAATPAPESQIAKPVLPAPQPTENAPMSRPNPPASLSNNSSTPAHPEKSTS